MANTVFQDQQFYRVDTSIWDIDHGNHPMLFRGQLWVFRLDTNQPIIPQLRFFFPGFLFEDQDETLWQEKVRDLQEGRFGDFKNHQTGLRYIK